uniref:EamA family transporter n=1 Tax=Paenibacillus albidus TaxID=2041023 RepID=UPI002035EFF6|nr:EamA family transporter [Paenibacillus albidus]
MAAVSIPFLFGWVHVRFTVRDIWRVVPLGLFSPVLFSAFQIYGLINTSSSEAGVIQATIPARERRMPSWPPTRPVVSSSHLPI